LGGRRRWENPDDAGLLRVVWKAVGTYESTMDDKVTFEEEA